MKKKIIISLISILIAAFTLTELFNGLKSAEYQSLGFSIYIIFLSFFSAIIFVSILASSRLQNNISYLIFVFFPVLGCAIFILAVICFIDKNTNYLGGFLVNLGFAIFIGISLYKRMRLTSTNTGE